MHFCDILAISHPFKGIKGIQRMNGISQHVHILNNDIPMNRFVMV